MPIMTEGDEQDEWRLVDASGQKEKRQVLGLQTFKCCFLRHTHRRRLVVSQRKEHECVRGSKQVLSCYK